MPVFSRSGSSGRIVELVEADGSGPTGLSTTAVLAWDEESLWVHVECRDDDPWATHRTRDAPLWEEEVVELFLAPGSEVPREYLELEVNPLGALFDARVVSPHGDRREMLVDPTWDWAGIEWSVRLVADGWVVDLTLPWCGLGLARPPALWRANLYRIDRPRTGLPPSFGCWSPTLTSPADFHRPERFGLLVLDGLGGRVPDGWPEDLPVLRVPRNQARLSQTVGSRLL